MKSEFSLARSEEASLKKAVDMVQRIDAGIQLLYHDHLVGKTMPRLRKELAELEKAIHEFNAYHNAIHTS